MHWTDLVFTFCETGLMVPALHVRRHHVDDWRENGIGSGFFVFPSAVHAKTYDERLKLAYLDPKKTDRTLELDAGNFERENRADPATVDWSGYRHDEADKAFRAAVVAAMTRAGVRDAICIAAWIEAEIAKHAMR